MLFRRYGLVGLVVGALLLGAVAVTVHAADGVQPGYWEQNRGSVLLTATAFALQTAFVVYLLVERRRRRRAEQSLEISERQNAATEDRLQLVEHQYNSILDDIGEQLVALQEEERRRIAAELHDSTAQHLVAIDLFLMRLRSIATGGDAEAIFNQIHSSLKEAQKELRIFTYLLYPPDLQREGLRATLQRFLDGFSTRTGIVVRHEIADGIDESPYALQRSILRILQEALANVHRHAKAAHVTIRLTLKQDRLDLRVADDGRGIAKSPSSGAPRHGVGIPGMQARVRHFGGTLKIHTGKRGTLVVASIPCSSPIGSDLVRHSGALRRLPERRAAAF